MRDRKVEDTEKRWRSERDRKARRWRGETQQCDEAREAGETRETGETRQQGESEVGEKERGEGSVLADDRQCTQWDEVESYDEPCMCGKCNIIKQDSDPVYPACSRRSPQARSATRTGWRGRLATGGARGYMKDVWRVGSEVLLQKKRTASSTAGVTAETSTQAPEDRPGRKRRAWRMDEERTDDVARAVCSQVPTPHCLE